MNYQTGKLYLRQNEKRMDSGQGGSGIRLGGELLSCLIYGSDTEPNSISEMENIRSPEDLTPITEPGWYTFTSLPKYIAFIGTADIIETTNSGLQSIKDIS